MHVDYLSIVRRTLTFRVPVFGSALTFSEGFLYVGVSAEGDYVTVDLRMVDE